ncbi:MAG: hypothetical protein JO171_11105 [Paludibacterium sp.]|uniref:hypothetical protein n=1 Tax=Paludibacterium sp. TaxID=1917523 RepID=UPI0025D1C6A7|nr:hypothetical protein [Paludibacterium sp.]MBV8047694.1 hypothetical protein [Paludibacterium sp.]MBV8649645.1 hypothetical protein [Paludibacterium sp.]
MPSSHAGANPGLKRIFGQTAEKEGVTLTAIRRRAQRQLSKFGVFAREQLDARGITIPPGVGLVGCHNCALTLDGEHPQAEALYAWIEGNVKLAKNFKEVEVLFEMLRAAEHPGQTEPVNSCFHIGLTSAGPVAYFQEHLCTPQGNA